MQYNHTLFTTLFTIVEFLIHSVNCIFLWIKICYEIGELWSKPLSISNAQQRLYHLYHLLVLTYMLHLYSIPFKNVS